MKKQGNIRFVSKRLLKDFLDRNKDYTAGTTIDAEYGTLYTAIKKKLPVNKKIYVKAKGIETPTDVIKRYMLDHGFIKICTEVWSSKTFDCYLITDLIHFNMTNNNVCFKIIKI